MSATDPRERLYWLIEEYINGHIDTQIFCSEFEQTYNLELDKQQLLTGERRAFQNLFDKVVYYSPIAEERARIVNYLGDDDIRTAVNEAIRDLRHSPIASN